MTKVNLHELANAPGYGKAQKELRKAGMWKVCHDEMLHKKLDKLSMAISKSEYAIGNAEYNTGMASSYFDDVMKLVKEAKQ